jgi:hypothetical protein
MRPPTLPNSRRLPPPSAPSTAAPPPTVAPPRQQGGRRPSSPTAGRSPPLCRPLLLPGSREPAGECAAVGLLGDPPPSTGAKLAGGRGAASGADGATFFGSGNPKLLQRAGFGGLLRRSRSKNTRLAGLQQESMEEPELEPSQRGPEYPEAFPKFFSR